MMLMEHQNFNQSVAAEIRAAMARKRISQSLLATMLGWNQSQLSKRLQSRIAFSTDELEQIAYQLGVPLEELTSPRAAAS
jgi:transcriptional regulator with XRE-family HTH domain